jgi:hypothetical protein
MNSIQISEARKLNGLKQARAYEVRTLKGLKKFSWLTARQLNKLAGALSVNGVERRTQISTKVTPPVTSMSCSQEWRA